MICKGACVSHLDFWSSEIQYTTIGTNQMLKKKINIDLTFNDTWINNSNKKRVWVLKARLDSKVKKYTLVGYLSGKTPL